MIDEKKLSRFLQMLVVVAAVLSFVGWYQYDDISEIGIAAWSALYKTLQTFIFETGFDTLPVPPTLQIAVYLAPLSLAGSLLFGIVSVARQRMAGLYLRLFARNHVVVAGPVAFCWLLLASRPEAARPGMTVLVVPRGEPVPGSIAALSRVLVLQGDPLSVSTWRTAALDHAGTLMLAPRDAADLYEITGVLEAVAGRRNPELSVRFALDTIAEREVFSDARTLFETTRLQPHCFQIDHLAATMAVERFAPHHFLPPAALSEAAAHLVLDGFTTFTKWLILESAQLYHYPSLKNLQITVVTASPRLVESFLNDYPGLTQVVDMHVVDEGDALPQVHNCDDPGFLSGRNTPCSVIIVPEDPWKIPERARQWRRLFALHADAPRTIPIRFILDRFTGNPALFKAFSKEWSALDFEVYDVSDFIDLHQIIDHSEVVDDIAAAIHESYQKRFGGADWDTLSDREKEFNRRSARHLKIKLNLIGYALSDDSSLPAVPLPEFDDATRRMYAQTEHKRWNSEKLLDGFIPGAFPEDRDLKKFYKNDLRIHQDIRPFDELTAADIAKDENTFADLEQLLHSVLERKRLVRL